MTIDELRKYDTGFLIDKATPDMLVHKPEGEAIGEAIQRTLSTEERSGIVKSDPRDQ